MSTAVPDPISQNRICGVILAGGQATRMGGGDKCLKQINGRTLLDMAISRASGQTGALVINANGDAARFDAYGLPVVADTVPGYAGPLAGVLAGMQWARANAPDCSHILSIAGDTPFFPVTLAADLAAPLNEKTADIAIAASGGWAHPVFGLWPVALADALRTALAEEGLRKIRLFLDRYKWVEVPYPDAPFDPFFNINTPDDIKQAERLARDV